MKTFLRTLFPILALTLATPALNAQARPTASGPGSYIDVGGGASSFAMQYGERRSSGGYVFADMHGTWRYGMEAEARFLRKRVDGDASETDFLVGPHVVILPGRIRPYVKFMAGAGRIVMPFDYARGTFFTYAPGGGVDFELTDRLAVRPVDFEYHVWTKFLFGPMHPYGISAGVSYRINGVSRFPKVGHARLR